MPACKCILKAELTGLGGRGNEWEMTQQMFIQKGLAEAQRQTEGMWSSDETLFSISHERLECLRSGVRVRREEG